MVDTSCEVVDARVRRTRQQLHEALAELLETKPFDRVSVQEIAEAAGVNRVTFYDHYADKYLLLKDMVAVRFDGLLQRRGVAFEGGCAWALLGVVVAVCDTLAAKPGAECPTQQMEPHFEAAVIEVVRRLVLDGVRRHAVPGGTAPEMVAMAVSWAIYGAAREWVRTPGRCAAEVVAVTIVGLVAPMLQGATPMAGGGTVVGEVVVVASHP